MQHSVAVANAQAKMDFWQEMARVAECGQESGRQTATTAEAQATGRGRTQFNVHEDLPGSEKNSNFEDNNKSRKDGNTESGKSGSAEAAESNSQNAEEMLSTGSSGREMVSGTQGSRGGEAVNQGTAYSYPKEIAEGEHYGKLKYVDNGVAVYVDRKGEPSIIDAHYSNLTYCVLYRDSRNRWAAEVINKDLSNRQFVQFTARAIDALPDNA